HVSVLHSVCCATRKRRRPACPPTGHSGADFLSPPECPPRPGSTATPDGTPTASAAQGHGRGSARNQGEHTNFFIPEGNWPRAARFRATCCEALFRRLPAHSDAARLHHHLDGILDAVLRIAQGGGKIVKGECMRMDLGGVEPLLAHERLGPMGRAL